MVVQSARLKSLGGTQQPSLLQEGGEKCLKSSNERGELPPICICSRQVIEKSACEHRHMKKNIRHRDCMEYIYTYKGSNQLT